MIHITPSYALHLVEEIPRHGINPPDLGVKKKPTWGPSPTPRERGTKFRNSSAFDSYNSYGMSEMNGPA